MISAMERYFVVHYHEVGLKKGNRDFFENRLCRNIGKALAAEGIGSATIRRISGRILVGVGGAPNVTPIKRALARVFGIAYFAEAWNSEQSLEAMERNAWDLIQQRPFQSFRIDTRRGQKSFPHTSVEINQRLGAYVKERCGARVDLERAERTCWVELAERYALMYTEREPGPGGLPTGTSGKVLVLLSGGIDSPVAAWKMIKRGCSAVFVHFHSFPYTNKESQEKTRQLAAKLDDYQFKSKLYLVPFADVQRHIMVETPT
jgi:thiamine biosynthesis protein ThiI